MAFIGVPLLVLAVLALWRYPAPVGFSVALWAAVVLGFAVGHRYWAVGLLALWPVVGWADWSGWLLVEEGDFLLAACVVGWCWGRWRHGAMAEPNTPPIPLAWMAWLALPALAAVIPWYLQEFSSPSTWTLQSAVHYHSPEAAVRLLKPYFWAAALAVMYLHDHVADPRAAAHRVAWGMTWGLILCSLAVVVERLTYTGLLNFSSDYRATGPFWEMHVGGAALDIYLALALPLAVTRLLDVQRGAALGVSMVAVALGLYATLVTFSRATYVGVALGLAVAVWLVGRGRAHLAQFPGGSTTPGASKTPGASGPSGDRGAARSATEPQRHGLGATALIVSALVGSGLLFPYGGYRGVGAWLMVVVLMPFVLHRVGLARRHRDVSTNTALCITTLVAVPAGWIAAEVATWLPKLIYIWTGLLFMGLLVAVRPGAARASAAKAWGVWALWVMLSMASLKVNLYWAEKPDPLLISLPFAALVWLALALRRQALALWPASPVWHLKLGMVLLAVPMVVGMVLGGAYMKDRTATAMKDGLGRLGHWQQSLAVLEGSRDAWFGKGLSRFAQEFRLRMMGSDLIRPGHQQVSSVEGRPALMIQGADPSMGFGEQHRVIQRMSGLQGKSGPFVFEAEVWAPDREVNLKVELCGRHLLYVADCAEGAVAVAPAPVPRWKSVRLELKGGVQSWSFNPLKPQPVLALISQTGGQKIWLRSVQLLDGHGRNHVANGQFTEGLDRWFFTSDRSHLPWSAKNMGVHLRVEQGWLGLLAWMALLTAALWRSTQSAWAGSVTQAGLAGSLVAVLAVAAIDSVVNHTRPLLLLLFMMLMSITLMQPLRAPRQRVRPGRP